MFAATLLSMSIGYSNEPPVATFVYRSFSTTMSADFDGRASHDNDGTIVSYSWDFGDGGIGSGAYVSHTYTTSGSYTVELTVTDNNEATDIETRTFSCCGGDGGIWT